MARARQLFLAATVYCAFGSAVMLAAGSPASAVPLNYTINPSSGIGSSSGAIPFLQLTGPGTVSFQSSTIDIHASLSLFPLPVISIAGSTSTPASISAVVAVNYYFQVVGPAGFVPVNVTAAGAAGGAGGDSFVSAMIIGNAGGIIVNAGITNSIPGSWSLNDTFSFAANQNYSVNMTAVGHTDLGSFFATVDPLFTIDLGFADLYHLEFSPGVGNQIAQTPLPAALPLFATILAGGGLMAWRRKRKAAKVAAA